jgi:hypothetical protein
MFVCHYKRATVTTSKITASITIVFLKIMKFPSFEDGDRYTQRKVS